MLSSTTRLKIQSSNTGRCAKLMGSGRSCPLPGRSIFTADSQQRSREQGELMPGDCAGRLKKEKRMVIFCAVRQREGELRTSDLSPFRQLPSKESLTIVREWTQPPPYYGLGALIERSPSESAPCTTASFTGNAPRMTPGGFGRLARMGRNCGRSGRA